MILKCACILDPNVTMKNYLKWTRMLSLNMWATEMEIIAAASMLSTTVYIQMVKTGRLSDWPRMAACKMGEEESIYITNKAIILKLLGKLNFKV